MSLAYPSSHKLAYFVPQIHFGAGIPNGLIAVLSGKIRSPQTLRKVVLEGHRFAPKEALEQGLVDHIVEGDTEDILKAAQTLATKLEPLAKTGAWGVNKVGASLNILPV